MTTDGHSPAPLERGVWGILATPFDAHGAVDIASLRRQIELFARCGARGVVALGVFGEAARLTDDERQRVARETLVLAQELALGVVVGITTLGREETIQQARTVAVEATRSRIVGRPDPLRGLMVQVPTPDGDELVAHLTAVHEATGAGVVVQDYPRASGVHIDASTLASAVARLPFVVAVKAESIPTTPAVAALTAGCGAPVFGGLGGVALLDELAAGAAGAMTGFSFPEGLVATVAAFDAVGSDAARRAWAPWLPLAVFEQQDGLALGIRKELLRRRGVLTEAHVRPPSRPFPTVLESILADHLADATRRLAEGTQ